MTKLKKGMVIDINLDPKLGSETGKTRSCIVVTNNIYNEKVPVIQVVPIIKWNLKKSLIKTNVEINSSQTNGLIKKSIADCLQTRPIDRRYRFIHVRGKLNPEKLKEIDLALRIVFEI